MGARRLGSRIEDGQWFLHGRSDDTIKVAGKRLGPAEVESALVSHPAVVEAAAVGLPDELKGEQLWAFVVLAPGRRTADALRAELAASVADHLGKSFRPPAVRFTAALPKTRSAKVVRRAIRRRPRSAPTPATCRRSRTRPRSTPFGRRLGADVS